MMNYWKPYENIIKKDLIVIGSMQQHGAQICYVGFKERLKWVFFSQVL